LNRNQIIEHLTKVSYIRETCNVAGCLADDLFQHIWVKLLEFDCDKLEQIYSKGYLQFYIYRMIINEARNPKNPFLKARTKEFLLDNVIGLLGVQNENKREFGNHARVENLIPDKYNEYDYDADKEFEHQVKIAKETLNEAFWYDRKIFELYLEFGSLRKVSAQTGIKYGAIHQTITKVKKQLNENIISRTF